MDSLRFCRYGPYIAAAIVLGVAVGVWIGRLHYRRDRQLMAQRHYAMALVAKAFAADNSLTYSAVSDTQAQFGEKTRHTRAKVVRTPDSLAISFIDGEPRGMQTGFNQHWFWRQQLPTATVEPYAEIKQATRDMAMKRFALMMENYYPEWCGPEAVDGRRAEKVELRPWRRGNGTRGARKCLWIDPETGLTLRVHTYNYQRQLVMQSTLSEVDYKPRLASTTLTSTQAMQGAKTHQPLTAQDMGSDESGVAKMTGLRPPEARFVPEGFELDGVGVHRCNKQGGGGCAALARYTDGLVTLTIFALRVKNQGNTAPTASAPPRRACNFGPGTLVTRDRPDMKLTAVADLPPDVLNRVLDSVVVELASTRNPAPQVCHRAPAAGPYAELAL